MNVYNKIELHNFNNVASKKQKHLIGLPNSL